jgi:hypothetical protein
MAVAHHQRFFKAKATAVMINSMAARSHRKPTGRLISSVNAHA